jgi:protein SCO1/2
MKKSNFWKQTIIYGLIFGVTLFGLKLYYQSRNTTIENASLYENIGGPFELKNTEGPFTHKDLLGRPSVLYFGFTSCPDVCPLSLNKLIKVLDKVDPGLQSKINKVFISVDYKRDTPQSVDEYGKYFAPDFISLVGNKEQTEAMAKAYAVHFEFVPLKNSALEYTVDHTSRFFLLNKEAKVIGSYSDITNDPQFIGDLKKLVN